MYKSPKVAELEQKLKESTTENEQMKQAISQLENKLAEVPYIWLNYSIKFFSVWRRNESIKIGERRTDIWKWETSERGC